MPLLSLVWMLAQIPVPLPGLDPRVAAKSQRLSLTSHSVAEVFDAEAHRWDPTERYRLDVETDALLSHAYGLDRESYAIVLDSFEVMTREQVKEHGYYRFKEDCLAALERFAAAERLVPEAAHGSA